MTGELDVEGTLSMLVALELLALTEPDAMLVTAVS